MRMRGTSLVDVNCDIFAFFQNWSRAWRWRAAQVLRNKTYIVTRSRRRRRRNRRHKRRRAPATTSTSSHTVLSHRKVQLVCRNTARHRTTAMYILLLYLFHLILCTLSSFFTVFYVFFELKISRGFPAIQMARKFKWLLFSVTHFQSFFFVWNISN